MKIAILAVGRLKRGPEKDLFEHYVKRFETQARPLGLAPVQLAELVETRAASAELRRRGEAARLRARWEGRGVLLALDERGKGETSAAFAARLEDLRRQNTPLLTFLIGGPDGLDPALRAQASEVLSLGPMTFPHGMARVLLAEQLYRAATILTGHPYHRA